MFKLSRHTVLLIFLLIAVFLETLSYTYMQESGRVYYYSSSLIYLIAGIFVALIPIFYAGAESQNFTPVVKYNRVAAGLYYAFIIGLLAYHISLLAPLYKAFTLDPKLADMLPNIQIACQRFLTGQPVYTQVHLQVNNGPGYIVPYLPVMWGACLPAEIFNFDLRWCTLAATFIPLFLLSLGWFKKQARVQLPVLLFACVSMFLFFNYFLIKYIGFWAMTEDAVTAGFYMLLFLVLLRSNYLLIGIAIACALLTRSVLLFWMPAYFLFILATRPRRDFLMLFAGFLFSFLILFIIPFFLRDPLYFIHLPGSYASGFHYFWEAYDLDKGLFYNAGLYKFFNYSQINLMLVLEEITGFAAPAIFLCIIWQLQKSRFRLNQRYVAVGGLKLSLVFVYNFLPAPYIYVLFPAALISYVVLFDFLAYNQIPEAVESGLSSVL
jgi:hypothetical protein